MIFSAVVCSVPLPYGLWFVIKVFPAILTCLSGKNILNVSEKLPINHIHLT